MKKILTLFTILCLVISFASTCVAQISHTINTSGNTFSPSSLTINVGDTVIWTNTGLGVHNVNGLVSSFPNNPQGFTNGVPASSLWIFSHIFTLAGTYEYQCDPHAPGMSGDIIANVIVPGCTDAMACNYNPLATIIDGSCNYNVTFSNPQFICPGDSYTIDGNTYTVAASYVDTFFNGAANLCDSIVTTILTVNSSPQSSVTSSGYNGFGVSCNGDIDGWIDLTVNGGVGVPTYAWSNGSTTEDLAGIGAGTYSVTATNNNGCTTSKTVVITESVTLTSLVDWSDYNTFGVSCNGDTDGWIDLTVNGGVDNQNYTYAWSNGFTTEDLSGIGIGTYSVLVTDANGCTTSETVVITEPDVFVGGQLSASQTICQNENLASIITIFSPTGGNPPYTFDWEVNDGSGFISLSNNNFDWLMPPALADTNIYRIIYSDDYQCDNIIELVTIIVNPLPVSFPIVGDMSVCSNQSDASYTLSTTPFNYRYVWFTNDGTVIGTNESRNCLIDWPSNPGTIANLYVDVWIAESECQITTSEVIDITVNEAPDKSEVVLKPNSTILACNDSSAGIQHQWGYDLISTGVSYDLVNDTLQYVQLSSVPDTNINRYWVDTYFNYPAGISCVTRSYYNEPPLPLDINEINVNNFSIYPNPVTNVLFFNYESLSEIDLKVIDLLGRNIDCVIDYENKSIRFRDNNPGIYMLSVKSNKSEFIKKFIIQ